MRTCCRSLALALAVKPDFGSLVELLDRLAALRDARPRDALELVAQRRPKYAQVHDAHRPARFRTDGVHPDDHDGHALG